MNNSKKITTLIIIVVAGILCLLLGYKHIKSTSYEIDVNSITNNKTQIFSLNKGSYCVTIGYHSNSDAAATVFGNNNCIFNVALPSTEGTLAEVSDGRLALQYSTEKAYVYFDRNEEDFVVDYIRITGEKPLYSDYLYYAFVLLLMAFILVLLINNKKIQVDAVTKGIAIGFIILLVITNAPFFMTKMMASVDIKSHLMRINGIFCGLEDHQFPVVVYPNFNNNFGQIGILYPNLFLYFPGVLRFFGVSLKTAYSLFVFLINTMTLLFAYWAFIKATGSRFSAAIGAAIYYLLPYRMRLMLAGGGIAGAGIALAFIPLVVIGLYRIITPDNDNKEKDINNTVTIKKTDATDTSWIMLAVGMSGLICSHIVTSLFGVIIAALICLVYFKKTLAIRSIIELLKAFVLFVLLSAGMIVPFLDYYFEDWNRSKFGFGSYIEQNGGIESLIGRMWQYRLVLLILVAIALILIIRNCKTGDNKFKLLLWIISAASMWMATDFFPWKVLYNLSSIRQFLDYTIQYQDRWLCITEPILGVLMGILIHEEMTGVNVEIHGYTDATKVDVKKIFQNRQFTLGIIIMFVLLWGVGIDYYSYFNDCTPLLYDEVTGEIDYEYEDYLPNGTVSEWYQNDAGFISDYDSVKIQEHSKIWTHILTNYTCDTEKEYIEYPLFYYKNYRAVDEKGNDLEIEKGDRNYIRVYLNGDNELHTINMFYKVRLLYKNVFLISFLSIIMVCVKGVLQHVGRKQKK